MHLEYGGEGLEQHPAPEVRGGGAWSRLLHDLQGALSSSPSGFVGLRPLSQVQLRGCESRGGPRYSHPTTDLVNSAEGEAVTSACHEAQGLTVLCVGGHRVGGYRGAPHVAQDLTVLGGICM